MNEDADTSNEAAEPEQREQSAGQREASGDELPQSGNDADPNDTTSPAGAEPGGAPAPDDDSGPGGWEEVSETAYEPLEGGGHRVTRRTVRRRVTVEDISEEVTEDLPPHAYRAPRSATHPAPVG